MNDSRFIKYDRRKIPGVKRTIPRNWTGDQAGKFFRCWNCGFTCNADRDQVGDGVGYQVNDTFQPVTLNLFDGNTRAHTLSISTIRDISLIEKDSDGNPKVFKHNFTTQVVSGCPFCGCRNYR